MRWLSRWRERERLARADELVRRAALACLDADRHAASSLIDLAWKLDREGRAEDALALLLEHRRGEREPAERRLS